MLTRLATSTIALGEVSTLNHELLDDTVELRALITESLLASSKRTVSRISAFNLPHAQCR